MRLLAWLLELWDQFDCLLAGHAPLTEHASGEIFLRCRRCGRRSDGWKLDAAKPKPAAPIYEWPVVPIVYDERRGRGNCVPVYVGDIRIEASTREHG